MLLLQLQKRIWSPVLTVWSLLHQHSVLYAGSTCVPIASPITQSNAIKTSVPHQFESVVTFSCYSLHMGGHSWGPLVAAHGPPVLCVVFLNAKRSQRPCCLLMGPALSGHVDPLKFCAGTFSWGNFCFSVWQPVVILLRCCRPSVCLARPFILFALPVFFFRC